MGTLTPALLRGAVEVEARRVAPATAARDYAALRACLNASVEADVIARSPLRGIKLAPVDPPDRVTLSAEQLYALADSIDARYRALVLIGGVLGLRWGEAVGLRLSSVDFLRKTLSVDQTISLVGGRIEVEPTKSRASRRTMTVPAFLIDELAAHIAAHRRGAGPADLIFVGGRGAPLRRAFGDRVLRPAVTAADLDPTITFHGLRHVAASLMVANNEHPRVMMARLGHATASISLELYSHVSDDADRAASDRLDAAFRAARVSDKGCAVDG